MTATDEFAPEFDPITDMLDREDAAQMSEQAKPVCVSCKLPIEREQRHAGHAGSGLFSHWNDAQCITALRAALGQERADARRYRAWRDGCVHETSKVAVALAKCVWPSDYDAAIDALLSGRGEGR